MQLARVAVTAVQLPNYAHPISTRIIGVMFSVCPGGNTNEVNNFVTFICILCRKMDLCSVEYQRLKGMRRLDWKPYLGLVEVHVMLREWIQTIHGFCCANLGDSLYTAYLTAWITIPSCMISQLHLLKSNCAHSKSER